MPWGCIGEWR